MRESPPVLEANYCLRASLAGIQPMRFAYSKHDCVLTLFRNTFLSACRKYTRPQYRCTPLAMQWFSIECHNAFALVLLNSAV